MLLQNFVGPNTIPLLLTLAGLILSIMEALAPGANFIVVGVALLAAGLVGLLVPVLATPFVLGLMVVAFGAAALYVYRDLGIYDSDGTSQTSDSTDLKGTMARVTERVTPTEGEVKLDDGGFNPYYSARSIDGEIAEGTRVMVVDPGGGNVVTVESVDADADEIDRELARERDRRAARERTDVDSEREREREGDPE
ncbi:NfeD family protein [Halobaculum sp. MBLA0143]|uniref:NfeD family protein n=1 Tax=Halobaculum sp. MBLA0143 TaxID=3079933 RepID=UPI0035262067